MRDSYRAFLIGRYELLISKTKKNCERLGGGIQMVSMTEAKEIWPRLGLTILIFTLFMSLFGLAAFVVRADALPAGVPWPNDPDFLVGVAGHPAAGEFTGYGGSDADIERQIHAAAEMGARIYRLDGSGMAIDFLEKVITLCERYDMEIMLVAASESSAETLTKRFKGRVKYYQVRNEMCFQSIKTEPGTQISHYRMSTDPDAGDNKCLDLLVNEAVDIIKRIRAEDPDAEVLINSTWIHYGMLDYAFARFEEEGIDVDLIGWDWYSNYETNRSNLSDHPYLADGFNSFAKYLHDRYNKDIIICEYNMWMRSFDSPTFNFNGVPYPGNGNDRLDSFEEENLETLAGPYLVKNLQYLYDNRNENHIKGLIIYELLEQTLHSNPFEAKFGMNYVKPLNRSQRQYQILGPKPQYYDVQKLLGGGFTLIERLTPSATIPEYMITASVLDEDLDGAIISSQKGGTVTGSGMYSENTVVTLTAAADPGCEFLGWYRGGIRISKNLVYQFTAVENANNDNRDSADGKFLYEARFVVPPTPPPGEYAIVYNFARNGGTSATAATVTAPGGVMVDLSPTATKADWDFVGWNTDERATTGITPFNVTSNVTLYAIYRKTLTATLIDYDADKVITRSVSATLYNKAVAGVVSIPPQNTCGWISRGWSTDTAANANPSIVSGSLTINTDVTLYGLYQKPVTIEYNANGGTPAPASQTGIRYASSYDIMAWTGQVIVLPRAIARTGYTFDGWINSINGAKNDPGAFVTPGVDVTYTAAWKLKEP